MSKTRKTYYGEWCDPDIEYVYRYGRWPSTHPLAEPLHEVTKCSCIGFLDPLPLRERWRNYDRITYELWKKENASSTK